MTRHVLFGAYTGCLMLAGAGALRDLFELSRGDESASHLILIPLVTLVLIYQARHTIFATVRPALGARVAISLAGAALLLTAGASRLPSDLLTVRVATMVVLWIGGFVVAYGRAASRAALFPLLFLAFAIPIPDALLNGTVDLLKRWSTELVAGLFTLTSTPYHRDGFVFSLPSFVIEVADECSGIRSSIALLLTSLLAAHMFLKTWWTKALIVAVILPLAILKNGIRIVSLSLLAVHVDPGFLNGKLHHEGGIVFFLLTLGLLAPLFVVLQRCEAKLPSSLRHHV